MLIKVLILVLPYEELGNIVPPSCDIFQPIHKGLVRLAGDTLTLVKPIKNPYYPPVSLAVKILIILKPINILIVLQSILLSVIIYDAITIMVLPQVLNICLHFLCHGRYRGDEIGDHQQYGFR